MTTSFEGMHLFSASGFSRLNIGDKIPDLSKAYPEIFSPNPNLHVENKQTGVARGIKLFQGDKFVHNVADPSLESIAEGEVLYIAGSPSKLRRWVAELDVFEQGYGLKKEQRELPLLYRYAKLPTTIYVAEDVKDIQGKDGQLVQLSSRCCLETFFIPELRQKQKVYALVHTHEVDGVVYARVIASQKQVFPFDDPNAVRLSLRLGPQRPYFEAKNALKYQLTPNSEIIKALTAQLKDRK